MFDEIANDLNQLIEAAFVDGKLSDKEKEILFKKALNYGIDLDEFEIILNAKLYRLKNENKSNKLDLDSKKIKETRKCPYCGAITESFSSNCLDCGSEFRNVDASQNITIFCEKINALELERKEGLFSDSLKKPDLSFSSIIKWWIFWWILIPINLYRLIISKTKPCSWSIVDIRKEEMIMNFPVPNSKEEMIEFITLSVSKIKPVSYFKKYSEEGKFILKWNLIWLSKAEQVFSKAKLSMKSEKNSIQTLEIMLSEARLKI
jgi:hypothetical protein